MLFTKIFLNSQNIQNQARKLKPLVSSVICEAHYYNYIMWSLLHIIYYYKLLDLGGKIEIIQFVSPWIFTLNKHD